ncbi:MAG: 23S rRNA (adenine(2503)-C(2))-methyltransferase RlmN [Erysipelotrichaceae bacterium]|nr:23S rRNA (adenine(2503)-C(2))-methyltransferase RlmN [Erysipelotrichaceae bacterium]
MRSIYDLEFNELIEWVEMVGLKHYQAKQIFQWLYRHRINSFDEMSDVALAKRDLLRSTFSIDQPEVVKSQISSDGTRKFLLKLQDGALVECVLMIYDYGKTICISSQVGCNMGCSFCASGLLKKQRDLTVAEMVSQVLFVQKELDPEQQRVSHVVIMGSGEPFDNYDNVMGFMRIINHDLGLAIGARHITVSTCGIVPRIYQFAEESVQYNLAISLHAPNDELRTSLMPINKAYPLKELMTAIRYYASKNNRRITFEYILLQGINDQMIHAQQLANLIKGLNAYVNLIPYNQVDEHGYRKVDYKKAMVFYDALSKLKVKCTLRQEHGADIDAACGQLRAKHERKSL